MWKESYRTGITIIDRQHRELLNRMSLFIESVLESDDTDVEMIPVKETIYFLEEYCLEHFQTEEDYQKKVKYPNYNSHKLEHEEFKKRMIFYKNRFENQLLKKNDLKKLAAELMVWFVLHIGREDKKIQEHAIRKGYL